MTETAKNLSDVSGTTSSHMHAQTRTGSHIHGHVARCSLLDHSMLKIPCVLAKRVATSACALTTLLMIRLFVISIVLRCIFRHSLFSNT
jgi:hypothetical protein